MAFTAMKWYNTTVHIARTPRALAREYRVLWVIMVAGKCGGRTVGIRKSGVSLIFYPDIADRSSSNEPQTCVRESIENLAKLD